MRIFWGLRSSSFLTSIVFIFLLCVFLAYPNNTEAEQPKIFVSDQKEKRLPTNMVMEFYKKFYENIKQKESNKWIKGYVNNLDKANQIILAKVLITDPDVRLSSLAIILSLKNDRVDLAIPKLTNTALSKTDLSEIYRYVNNSENVADKEKILKKIDDAIRHTAKK